MPKQLAFGEQSGTIANKNVFGKAPDYVKEFASKTKQQDIDQFVGQHIDQWVEKVTLECQYPIIKCLGL